MKISAIITAGGTSSRFGKSNKLLEKINGKTVIEHSVSAFLGAEIDDIIICANPAIIDEITAIFAGNPKIRTIKGGKTRQASVFNGLNSTNCDYVLIHDGARPMISPEIIHRCVQMVQTQRALTVATKTTDTIKEVQADGKIVKTLDRSVLYNTQTPQAFDFELIKNAHNKLVGKDFTDDAGMLESLNMPVYVLEGDYKNIKITTQSDLEIAKTYL